MMLPLFECQTFSNLYLVTKLGAIIQRDRWLPTRIDRLGLTRKANINRSLQDFSHISSHLQIKMASEADAKFELITRRLQEVLGADSIKAILAEGRTPKCYWGMLWIFNTLNCNLTIYTGTAPTGRRM